MQQALAQYPVQFADRQSAEENPLVSFIIPHRGKERLPLLRAVICSILAQKRVPVECIVVEQNATQEVHDLPPGVKYIHLPHPEDPDGWHKAWAFNKGVQGATADIFVYHDGDILVPVDYASEIVRKIRLDNYEVVHLHRFLFCLDEMSTANITSTRLIALDRGPERIRQNWKGGTLAITRRAYWQIGGFDERFVGWSGEDREFFDRCLALKGYRYGYLPFVHLWHPAQPTKHGDKRGGNLRFTDDVMAIPREQRIQDLRRLQAEDGATMKTESVISRPQAL